MARPRILIPIPTSFDEPYNQKCWPEYAAAVTESGGDPVKLALTHSAAELEQKVSEAGGILLPGSGADVEPTRYGHKRQPESAEADALREQTDFALFEAALRHKRPLLGICFGAQSMNVFHGGTLVQDLQPVPVNHRAPRTVAAAHAAVISRDSRLGRILANSGECVIIDDKFSRLFVNSSHHQAIAIPGDELRVVARSPEDAVIEALEGSLPDHWMIGVQWHPERTFAASASSRAIFNDFVQAASV